VTKTPPSVYDVDEYYADNASGSRLSPAFDGLLRILDRARVRAVVEHTGLSAGKVLDVGAGDGKFLHFMERLGFEVHGTTTSKRSAHAAKALFGLRLDVSENLENQLPEGPFDLVTYWHVFEHLHLEELPAHREQWRTLVRPGGFLVIEAPNIRSVGARLCYRSWLGSDEKHHINHQPPATIVATLRELGFDPIRTEYFSTKFSYVYLWSALLGFLFGRQYDFDGIMSILKTPSRMLRKRPLWTINAMAAVMYLAPVIVGLMLYGMMTGQGEVLRVYAKKATHVGRAKAETQ
jgi:SAM-dependent methyltransferase